MNQHMTAYRLLGPLACATLLAGCMPALREAPALARVETPSAWTVAAPQAAAIDAQWWKAFGDPALSAAVEAALLRNGDILIAATRIEQAQAELRLADAALGPSVSAAAGAQAGRALGSSGMATTRSAQPGLQASWELDLWGRLRDQTRAAALQLQATQADHDAVALSIAANTAQSYIGLLGLEAQLQQTRETAASRAEALRLARDKFAAGYISELELTQSESEYHAAQQRIPNLELAISRQYNALRLLAGELPAARIADAGNGRFMDLILPTPAAALPSELLRRRPDIASAEFRLAASDATLAARRTAFLPQVALSASIGALYVNALDYDPAKVWSVGGSILAPIFDRGRLQAQFDAATAQRDAAAYSYRTATLNAFSEVENALSGQLRLAQQLDEATKQRDVLRRSLEHARNRYEAGYASYLEQLDAQRSLFQAEIEVIALHQSRFENLIALYKALGGGWEYRATPSVGPRLG